MTTDDLMRLKFVGYDRACDFHPFLMSLSKKGNIGAKILLDNVNIGGHFSCGEAQRTMLYACKQSKVPLSSSSRSIRRNQRNKHRIRRTEKSLSKQVQTHVQSNGSIQVQNIPVVCD